MDAVEIIEAIRSAKKKTPVKAYIRSKTPLTFENCHVFTGTDMVVIGDYADIEPVLAANQDAIEDVVIENDRRNSALPLLDMKHIGARIEPGGDMAQAHQAFLTWAAAYDDGGVDMRSRAKHDEWQKLLRCPLLVLRGDAPLEETPTDSSPRRSRAENRKVLSSLLSATFTGMCCFLHSSAIR